MVEYGGGQRFTLPGSLAYPGDLPELGTVLGPNAYQEHVTVVAYRDGRALVAPSTSSDLQAARELSSPRSVAEQTMLAAR